MLTDAGGVYRAIFHRLSLALRSGYLRRRARLMTAHQIGTVLDSASGIFFPERVESTNNILHGLTSMYA